MSSEETEVLLATLISLLNPPIPPHKELLNALADNDGDPEAAALALPSMWGVKSSQKRKRAITDLDDWLQLPKCEVALKGKASSSTAKRVKPESQGSHKTPKISTPAEKPLSAGYKSIPPKPTDLMTVLRYPTPNSSSVPRLLPLTLSDPSMVAEHTPCTLHYSILPPDLACELFYTMLDAAQSWSRNKWWLFDRLVESPHRTSFFVRVDNFGAAANGSEAKGDPTETWKEAAQYWYNGRKTDVPLPFPEEMEAACQYIEKVVNEEIRKRERFPLEWGGSEGGNSCTWRANVAASNCYEGAKESVGFHSDQLTYLGPYPTIASLSLGTTRTFRLREVIPSSESSTRQARTYNIPLPHNSLIIMHASTQERFKHCVPPQPAIDIFRPPFPRRTMPGYSTSLTSATSQPSAGPSEIQGSNCRINITFRFYRPDYPPESIPRCKCGVPCILRPDMKHRVDRKTALTSSARHSISLSDKDGRERDSIRGDESHNGEMTSLDGSGIDKERCYTMKYWWTCYSGAQNEGKGCGMWKVMDVGRESRGPFVGDNVTRSALK